MQREQMLAKKLREKILQTENHTNCIKESSRRKDTSGCGKQLRGRLNWKPGASVSQCAGTLYRVLNVLSFYPDIYKVTGEIWICVVGLSLLFTKEGWRCLGAFSLATM